MPSSFFHSRPFDSPNGGHVFSPEKVTYGSKQGHFEEPGLCCPLVYINRFHTFITLSFPNQWVLKAKLVSFYSSLFSPMFSCHRLIFSSAKELLHLCLECLCIIVKVSRAGRDGADSCHPSSGNCVVVFLSDYGCDMLLHSS